MLDLHIHLSSDDKLLKEIKSLIIQNQNTIMANLQELQAKVQELQASVDAEQAQVQALLDNQTQTITSLNEQIANLQALVDAAPTPEQLQEVVDQLSATKADIESTVADAASGGDEEPA